MAHGLLLDSPLAWVELKVLLPARWIHVLDAGGDGARCRSVKMVGCVAGAGARRRFGSLMCCFVWRRKLAVTVVLLSVMRWLPWRLFLCANDGEEFAVPICSPLLQVR
ncbi:hypothetical protein DEO72_LG2g2764 [Vigna unguiculata]|uniref:Uncharacterized protein n=1 Tax=Vigna unguiculata TaxID=3917 RepID=A0A4D6L1S5_VIGUN|nr:hypothetical protein DEO72_LG2g2764 [Vigna unguiculata]